MRHHAILHQAIAAHQGHVFQIIGDAFCAAFYTASDALNAALDAQRGLQHEAWSPAPIKVRMGLHTGAAQADATEERARRILHHHRWAKREHTADSIDALLCNPTCVSALWTLSTDGNNLAQITHGTFVAIVN